MSQRMQFRYPDKPTLTTTTAVAQLNEKDFLAQWKYDGYNIETIKEDDGFHFFSSSGTKINGSPKFPARFLSAFNKMDIPNKSVLNIEHVGPRGNHRQSLYIFDMLAWDGRWLINEGFQDRWARCVKLSKQLEPDVFLAYTIDRGFLDEFARLRAQWIAGGKGMDLTEGLVLKRKTGKLVLGRDSNVKSNVMQKIKYRDIRCQI